jgi:30S ribosomal protein S31
MGKGDKKTRKGKIYRGSYGKTRPKKRRAQTNAKARAAEARGGAAGGTRGR